MSRILLPTSEIKVALGIEPEGRIQRFFTHECKRRMEKYVPRRNGPLRDTAIEGDDYVEYVQPYAHYQYLGVSKNGKPFVKYTTPGTGSYWDKRMWSAEKDLVIQAVQDELRR